MSKFTLYAPAALSIVVGAGLFAVGNGCSSSTDVAQADASTASDASSDVKLGKDAPAPVADSSTAEQCVPGDVTSFTPTWKPPTPFNQKVCTTDQIERLIKCAFDGLPDQDTCDAFLAGAENTQCYACLSTDISASAWGPIIDDQGTGTLNSGGCIANFLNDGSKTGCGAKYTASRDCGFAACDSNCSGKDVTNEQFDGCLSEADSTVCASYSTSCADGLLADGGIAAQCDDSGDFTTSAIAMGTLFCGGLVLNDAGAADAPVDAPADAPDGG